MLSDDDVNLRDMTDDELEAAWDLWFDLAQATNEFDPPYTHGALAYADARQCVGVVCRSPAWPWTRCSVHRVKLRHDYFCCFCCCCFLTASGTPSAPT
jgi:hypothetical protein